VQAPLDDFARLLGLDAASPSPDALDAAGRLIADTVICAAAAAPLARSVAHRAIAAAEGGSGEAAVIGAGTALPARAAAALNAEAAILPLSYGIIRREAPEGRGIVWRGVLSGAYSAAGAIGFALGGWLTDRFGWRSIFHLTAALPLVAILAVFLFVRADEGTRLPRAAKPYPAEIGFDRAFVYVAVTCAMALLLALALPHGKMVRH